MKPIVINTQRLSLAVQSVEDTLARIEAMSPEDRAQVSPEWLASLRASSDEDPWTHGFVILDRTTGKAIGSCAFKGPPDSSGAVEIAYETNEAHRGRGYATEAARALTDFAFEHANVRIVRAHTLPEDNASTRVLTKCGFNRLGEVIDPEDGLVWRWEQGKIIAAD